MSNIRHLPAPPTHAEARDSGDVIDRHQHDNHQLIYVSTGVLAIRTALGTWLASSNRAVWVPAGIWHEHRFYGRSLFHTMAFAGDDAPLPPARVSVIIVGDLLRELIIAGTEADLPTAETERIRAVLRDRLVRANVEPLSMPTAHDPRLANACRLVVDDLGTPRSLTWLARATGTSDRTLTRLFRTEFGTTYPQWRTNARVFRAMIELAQDATVTDTARHCGWATASAFIDTFTRAMGQTPGAYRAAVRPR
ncbi:MAG TPA: helix-turn-helix transcriptional regulator [Pseudonocardiaceae bacterium]|nr:helix-turn-helix transcriptional regulator [Pseudonocardiaceae bacterium]